jgi:hypothetical protein
MLNVTFYGPGGAALATVPMDVPRVGEQVAVEGGAFTVAVVRYYISPGPTARAAILLTPVAAETLSSQHYQELSLAESKNK